MGRSVTVGKETDTFLEKRAISQLNGGEMVLPVYCRQSESGCTSTGRGAKVVEETQRPSRLISVARSLAETEAVAWEWSRAFGVERLSVREKGSRVPNTNRPDGLPVTTQRLGSAKDAVGFLGSWQACRRRAQGASCVGALPSGRGNFGSSSKGSSPPLEIARVVVRESDFIGGVIGISECPGKRERDLKADLDRAIGEKKGGFGAEAVVTLIENSEMEKLGVTNIGREVVSRGALFFHLPIRDFSASGGQFESLWRSAGPKIRSILRRGGRVLVHCRGGIGRAGTVAARLLVEMGEEPEEAIRKVRRKRPGAIETLE
uniref:protein-tyrosine-phosphatase n=1 Tax=Chromera velia CCMP2878 TaxID=1169474 RepID=A0A0G4HVJ0_9ALVE|eukprot:Cvel_8838.t1-p1 / transcript=Cvel_8838.t1 / gene=Cvel_8838 / organism=Chromera_velia_CCMP2878 / gene_product=Cyclin-dependent kinase inhibitor 3, putative / transcript_product=Cyclin-dependent kinase inhibitor 3, putative / location=Cvel_scaffold496:14524-15474(+) / protein_length=317 / sequence_SO=supercontig / SO=protein_coding / is_pseudo=false